MDIESTNGPKRIFQRLGNRQFQQPNRNPNSNQNPGICYQWQSGRCDRHPCRFLHSDVQHPPPLTSHSSLASTSFNSGGGGGGSKRPHSSGRSGPDEVRKNPSWGSRGSGDGSSLKKLEKVCNYWVSGSCVYGDRCKFLHSWSIGDCFSLLTTLDGHQKVVTGIALPAGKDKLYTGSKDENVRIWDCQSGQCINTIHLGGEIGCMISEGPWVLIGLPNMVKAWNIETVTDMTLTGPVGQVYALTVGSDMLFAGTQDGSILAWKFNPVTNCFEPAASLTGHTRPVVTMVVGANRLYSGAMDNTIRVWNLETLQCIQTLADHTSVVMSLLCWDQFLLSASLDNTIKVWAATPGGSLEVTYTHTEEHGLLTLCGICDSEGKPILVCSSNDNTVRLYDLPSFMERGKIFSKKEIRVIQSGPGGLFFTGDGTGQVRVWQWKTDPLPAM